MASVEELWLPALGRQVRCRPYRPTDAAGPAPTVVYLHGGGWTTGSLDTHDKFCRDIAKVSGWTVLAVDYALSPEAAFPQAVNEVFEVVAHLRREGAALGLDASRLVLAGDSAGGNLALGFACVTAARRRSQASSPPIPSATATSKRRPISSMVSTTT